MAYAKNREWSCVENSADELFCILLARIIRDEPL